MKPERITFRNPVTRRMDSAYPVSKLGRAVLAVKTAPKSRAARRVLREICAEIQLHEDRAYLIHSRSAQRQVIEQAAATAGRSFAWLAPSYTCWACGPGPFQP